MSEPDRTFIYILGSARGSKKIGLARRPALRRRGVQTGSDKRIDVLHAVEIPLDRARDIERRAHWLLRAHRLDGEWFRVSLRAAKLAVLQAVSDNGNGQKAAHSVGRPKMNVTPTLVRLPEGIAERIDAVAGKNRRAEFIRDAVERELKRREKEAAKAEPS